MIGPKLIKEETNMKLGIIRCMQTEDYCPFAKRIRELVQKEVGDGILILDYTHDAGSEPETSQK